MTSNVAPPVIPAGWLRGTSFDGLFIVGVMTLALFIGGVVSHQPYLFDAILFLDLWLLGYHHVISTYTRLCFDRESWLEHRTLLIVLLPAVLIAVFTIGNLVGFWIIATIYLYWQWFHYTRQSWGIQQAYRGKSGGLVREDPRLTKATFYLLPLWGILHRSHQAPEKFIGMEVWVLPVSGALVTIVGIAALASLGLWGWQRIQAFLRGEGPLAHTLYMVSHLVMFAVGYLVIDDISHGWLAINVWHNAQYILFVWFFNTNRFRDGVSVKARFLSWLSQPRNWHLYFGFCLLVTYVIYSSLSEAVSILDSSAVPYVIVLFQSINFHHYIVDSMIWKLRKPKLKTALSIDSAE